MGRRTRRSTSNIISAAILEVFIMGLFVIIAQPQLRDALMGILHVGEVAPSASTLVPTPQNSGSSPPVAQPANSLLPRLGATNPSGEASAPLSTVSQLAGMAANAFQGIANATAPAGSTNNSLANDARQSSSANAFSTNTPLEQYESFRVTVPSNNAQTNPVDYGRALPSTSSREVPSLSMVPFSSQTNPLQTSAVTGSVYPTSQFTNSFSGQFTNQPIAQSVNQAANYPMIHSTPGHFAGYTQASNAPVSNTQFSNTQFSNTQVNNASASYAPASYAPASYAPASYAPAGQGLAPFSTGASASYAPTQIAAGQWNIASANQSPHPAAGWNVIRPQETSYQEPYPPPYGTQSQWK